MLTDEVYLKQEVSIQVILGYLAVGKLSGNILYRKLFNKNIKSLLIISSSDDLLSQLRLVNKFRYREKILYLTLLNTQNKLLLIWIKKTQSRSQEIAFVFNFSMIIPFISFRLVLFFIYRPEFVFYFYFFLYFSFCKFTGLQYYKTTMLQYNSTTNLLKCNIITMQCY